MELAPWLLAAGLGLVALVFRSNARYWHRQDELSHRIGNEYGELYHATLGRLREAVVARDAWHLRASAAEAKLAQARDLLGADTVDWTPPPPCDQVARATLPTDDQEEG